MRKGRDNNKNIVLKFCVYLYIKMKKKIKLFCV